MSAIETGREKNRRTEKEETENTKKLKNTGLGDCENKLKRE